RQRGAVVQHLSHRRPYDPAPRRPPPPGRLFPIPGRETEPLRTARGRDTAARRSQRQVTRPPYWGAGPMEVAGATPLQAGHPATPSVRRGATMRATRGIASETGSGIVIVALTIVVLLCFFALAIDLWLL